MMNNPIEQSGRSIIEMLGVLAIIGVLTVGGIAGFSSAMSKYKITRITDEVQRMVTNIRSVYAGKRSYAGLDNKTAYTLGILNNEQCADENCAAATNAFSGSILLGVPNKAHYFSITYNGLTRDACTRLAMNNWGDATSGLVAVVVKGSAQGNQNSMAYSSDGLNVFTTDKHGDLPIPLAKAVAACRNLTATGEIDGLASITWVYR